MSLPAWECGLKYAMNYQKYYPTTVTPCVGVWIEIPLPCIKLFKQSVTPCVGVWIEMFTWTKTDPCICHSLRGSVD